MALTQDTINALKIQLHSLQDQKTQLQAQLQDVNNHMAPLQDQKTTIQAKLSIVNIAITNIKADGGL